VPRAERERGRNSAHQERDGKNHVDDEFFLHSTAPFRDSHGALRMKNAVLSEPVTRS
jgi:hypothetical protein